MLLQKILNLIGIPNPTVANTNTIMNYLKKIDDKPVPGSVVQRGVKSVNAGFKGETTVIISEVDMTRAHAKVEKYISLGAYPTTHIAVGYLSANNTLTLNVNNGSGNAGEVYWEVTEL